LCSSDATNIHGKYALARITHLHAENHQSESVARAAGHPWRQPYSKEVPMPSKPFSPAYQYIVRELAPTEHEPDEAPITIVCEPLSTGDGATPSGAIFMRLMAGTTPDEARAIASTLQAKVKGLCHLDASGDQAA
jgi:hypothetical protein